MAHDTHMREVVMKYFPAVHVVALDAHNAASAAESLPKSQTMHFAAPAVEYSPAEHAEHSLELMLEYIPAAQS